MKNITIVLVVLITMTIKTNAQIPNNGFENWINAGNYDDPTEWATMNPYCSGPFYSALKSTDHYPASVGNYSIRVENNTSLTQFTGGYGMAMTNSFDYPFKPAFPIVGNPTSLCGYFKYNSLNNDSLFIRIVFFENSIMLGYNTFITGITTPTWTSFTLPLTYPSADSATIYFSAFYPSGQFDGPNGNSVLFVDNLSFDNLISSISEQNFRNNTFSLYPNPDYSIVNLNIENAEKIDLTLNIYDVLGALVKSEILKQNQRQINIVDLCNGTYIFEIKSKEWAGKQKLVIQR